MMRVGPNARVSFDEMRSTYRKPASAAWWPTAGAAGGAPRARLVVGNTHAPPASLAPAARRPPAPRLLARGVRLVSRSAARQGAQGRAYPRAAAMSAGAGASAGVGIAPLARAFRDGSDDPVRALQRALEAADRGEKDRALLWRVPAAMPEAVAARLRFQQGTPMGPLDGVPLVVKDSVDVAGLPSTNGTRFLLEPVANDALLVARLRRAGAVVFAKANMHEFGIQPTGVNPHHGTPVNPWDPLRIPGGSSSGPAVAVASGIAAAAIGTDAGGSIRVPATINGLVGLKPTLGAVPQEGVAGLTFDLDHSGPLAW